jgi:hypothetical protein
MELVKIALKNDMLKSIPPKREKKVLVRLWDLVAKIAFKMSYTFSLDFILGQRENNFQKLPASR